MLLSPQGGDPVTILNRFFEINQECQKQKQNRVLKTERKAICQQTSRVSATLSRKLSGLYIYTYIYIHIYYLYLGVGAEKFEVWQLEWVTGIKFNLKKLIIINKEYICPSNNLLVNIRLSGIFLSKFVKHSLIFFVYLC